MHVSEGERRVERVVVTANPDQRPIGVLVHLMENIFGYRLQLPATSVTSTTVRWVPRPNKPVVSKIWGWAGKVWGYVWNCGSRMRLIFVWEIIFLSREIKNSLSVSFLTLWRLARIWSFKLRCDDYELLASRCLYNYSLSNELR